MNLRELIDGIKDDGKFRAAVGMVADAMEKGWSKWKTFRHVYRELHGSRMCPECCRDMVSMMESSDADGKERRGEHWSMEQCSSLARKVMDSTPPHPECELYAAMNMMWHDYRRSMMASGVTGEGVYARMACDYLGDPDAPEGKLLDYYLFLCKGKEAER